MTDAQRTSNDRLCTVCRKRESEHKKGLCPPHPSYFTPCLHPNAHGFGRMGADGTSSGYSYCTVCGEKWEW